MFAVPQAPGNGNSEASDNSGEGRTNSTESSDNSFDEKRDPDEKEGNMKRKQCNLINILTFFFVFSFFCFTFQFADAIVYRNGNNGHHMHKSESLEDDLQRAISTAERRKVNFVFFF